MSAKSVLIVEKDGALYREYNELLFSWRIQVSYVADLPAAFVWLRNNTCDMAICDTRIGDIHSRTLFEEIDQLSTYARLVITTDNPACDDDVKAIRLRGVDVLQQPFSSNDLFEAIMRSLNKGGKRSDKEKLLAEIESKMFRIDQHATMLGRLELLAGTLLMALPSVNSLDEVENDLAASETNPPQPFSHNVRPILAPLLEALRRDDAVAKYRLELSLIEEWIENLDEELQLTCVGPAKLSFREMKIATMIKNGMTTDRIAEQLHIAPDTVKTHRRNIRKKLGLVGDKCDLASFLSIGANPTSATRSAIGGISEPEDS